MLRKVQERRHVIFQDKLVKSPEDLLKQNNLYLRETIQANSVERHEQLALASQGRDSLPPAGSKLDQPISEYLI